MKKNQFDPHTSFIDLPIFRKTIYISTLISGLTAAAILIFSDLEANFTFNGFNQALTVFKFPLGILGVTIPIIALLAANHRSEQTREQMKLASANNNFTNYFKHLSEFQSYLESHQTEHNLKIKSTRNFHKMCFPAAKHGNYQACKNLAEEIFKLTLETIKKSNTIKEYKDKIQEITTSFEAEKLPLKEELEASSTELERIREELKKARTQANTGEDNTHTAKQLQKLEIKITTTAKVIQEINDKAIALEEDKEGKCIPFKEKIQQIEEELIKAANLMASNLGITYNVENAINTIKIPIPNTNHGISEITTAISTIAKTTSLSFEFDENYQTPIEIELFTKHFSEKGRINFYSFWINKQRYTQELEDKKSQP